MVALLRAGTAATRTTGVSDLIGEPATRSDTFRTRWASDAAGGTISAWTSRS
jgi:hypothetical protein